jgi:hypothetical protein
MARARGRLIPMLLVTADQWLASVPDLQRAGRQATVEGAESLWVLGQVYERLGEERGAIEAYSTLIDRHRALAEGAPGQRLLRVWKERTRQLYAMRKPMDVLGLHTTIWRPMLTNAMTESGPLWRIADDYAKAGLPERALRTLQDVVDIEGRAGRDTHAAAVKVAALYLDLDRPEEALEAARWLREGGLGEVDARDITRVEALALKRRGVAWRARSSTGRRRGSTSRSGSRTVATARARLRRPSGSSAGSCPTPPPTPSPSTSSSAARWRWGWRRSPRRRRKIPCAPRTRRTPPSSRGCCSGTANFKLFAAPPIRGQELRCRRSPGSGCSTVCTTDSKESSTSVRPSTS